MYSTIDNLDEPSEFPCDYSEQHNSRKPDHNIYNINVAMPQSCDSESLNLEPVNNKQYNSFPSKTKSTNVSFVPAPRKQVNPVKPKVVLTRNPPILDKDSWAKYDKEFDNINQNSWKDLRTRKVTPEKFVSDLNIVLANFLESKVEFQKECKDFYQHKAVKDNTLENMRKLKTFDDFFQENS